MRVMWGIKLTPDWAMLAIDEKELYVNLEVNDNEN